MADDKLIGHGVGFDRTRRITGYLVGSLERFNNAKRSEVRDRVLHGAISDRAAILLASKWERTQETEKNGN